MTSPTLTDKSLLGDAIEVVCIASWNVDLISQVARPIARGETLMANAFTMSPGGKGSNASVACSRQGVLTAVVARIGEDSFGDMAMRLWQAEGINTSCVERVKDEPSGVAQIFVFDDGDNSIAVATGAGASLSAAQVRQAGALIRTAKVVMASCEVPLIATLEAFQIAKNAGVITLLNPAPAGPLLEDVELAAKVLALCDILTPNETEVRSLTRADSIEGATEKLLLQGVGTIVVTLGENGCQRYKPHALPYLVPGIAISRIGKIADTIGAGDTFTGALAAALSRNEPIDIAIVSANRAAALSVLAKGAIDGMPSLAASRALNL
jgi:ribokinase